MNRLLAILVLASCSVPPAMQPTPTDLGCGAWGVSCGSNRCCDEGNVCKPPTKDYPVGYCEYIGGDGMFGSRKPMKLERTGTGGSSR